MNISPHIGRYPQTPAPVCSHYHYSMLSKILSKHCGLWSPLSSLHIDAGRVLSGLVIVTDEAPVLGWGGPGPGNDIMTGWPCTHHTSHPGIITRISHTLLSRHLVHATHHHRQFWIPLNTHWTIGKQTTFSCLTYKKRGNESSWQKWIIATELFFLWPHDVFVKCSGQNHLLTTHTSTRPGHEARQTSGQHLEMPRITPGSGRTEYLCCVELQTSPMFNQN